MKKAVVVMLMATMLMGTKVTAYAAPKDMGNGIIFNRRMNYRFGTNNKPDTYPSDYTPKYLREQQQ